MIIREIYIDGFGLFRDFIWKDLSDGLNIIVADNEMGKSTLMAFVRYTLFGYPHPRSKDNPYPPLNGGKHGGRIKAAMASTGKEAIFERHSGAKGGAIHLRYNGRESKDQSQWQGLLGNAGPDLFNNVYTFSLDELVNLNALSKSGVEDKIFSLGLGLGDISLGMVEQNIRDAGETIYKKGGRSTPPREIVKRISEIKESEHNIAKIQGDFAQYEKLVKEIEQLEGEEQRLNKDLEALRRRALKLDHYHKCHTSFLTLINIDEKLEQLPAYRDLPPEGDRTLNELEKREQSYTDQIRSLKQGTEDEPGIGEIEQKLEPIAYNADLLNQRDRVDFLRKNLEKYKQFVSDRAADEQKIAEYNDSIKQGIQSISGQWTERTVAAFSDTVIHRNKIEYFEGEIAKSREKEGRLEEKLRMMKENRRAYNINVILSVFAVLSLIASAPAIYHGLYVLGGALITTGLVLALNPKYVRKEDGLERTEQELIKDRNQLEKLENNYGHYLQGSLQLPPTLKPQTVLDILRTVGQLQREIRERDNIKAKLENERLPFIRHFEQQVEALERLLPDHALQDALEIRAHHIINAFNESRSQYDEKQQLQKTFSQKKKALQAAGEKLEEVRTAIAELLQTAEAGDRASFRKIYEQNRTVAELQKEREGALRTIETIVGKDNAGEVIEYFNQHDKNELEFQIQDLKQKIQTTAEDVRQVNTELGSKRNDIKKLEDHSQLAEFLTEVESKSQQLHTAFKEWLGGQLALRLLTQEKARYEKEKQPEVIKYASRYFKKMSDDRYQRIRVSLEEKDVTVYDQAEVAKNIDQLSRGTKEQLLISLRLGFIEEYEKQAEALPLVVDEVLVNFDPQRAQKAAEILTEFAEQRQILMFTCHPETKEFFDAQAVNIIRLNQNGMKPQIS